MSNPVMPYSIKLLSSIMHVHSSKLHHSSVCVCVYIMGIYSSFIKHSMISYKVVVVSDISSVTHSMTNCSAIIGVYSLLILIEIKGCPLS